MTEAGIPVITLPEEARGQFHRFEIFLDFKGIKT
jgi:hypothetical protein